MSFVFRKIIIFFFLFILIPAFAAPADIYQFDTPSQQRQFQKLSKEFRCLVCQNQSLADSNAPLALDLRYQIYKMVKQHKDNEEIISFLTNRYSDFITFHPRLSRFTFLLWFGPFIMLFVALFRLFILINRNKRPKKSVPLIQVGKKRMRHLIRQL